MTHSNVADSENKEGGCKASHDKNHCSGLSLLRKQTQFVMIGTPPEEFQVCLVVLVHVETLLQSISEALQFS